MNEKRKRAESRASVAGSVLPPPRHSWDRQPGEGDMPFEAFVVYRDMGAGRTARKVAMRMGKAPSHIIKYSSLFNWKERTTEYDAHLDRTAQQEREAAIKEMARKHTMAAEFLWRKALQVIQAADIKDIKVAEAIAMFRAALPAERQGRMADAAHVPSLTLAQMYRGVMADDEDDDAMPESSPDSP